MTKKITFFVTISVIITTVLAQQDPQFTNNTYNKLFVNPGYAGSNKAICGTFLGRKQWVGFDGAPTTGLISVDANVAPFGISSGAGITILSDQLGQEKTFGAKLSYAYRRSIGTGELGLGIDIGIVNKSIGRDWKAIDPVENDFSIPDNGASNSTFDLSFGAYYNTDKLYFGISSLHIPQTKIKASTADKVDLVYTLRRHYYIMAGYFYTINPSLELQPSVFIKSDAASSQLDLNINLLYNNLIWAGVNYRVQDAASAIIGINVPNVEGLKIAYSYDIVTSQLRSYNSGSHEIMIRYCYKKVEKINIKKYKSVRFL